MSAPIEERARQPCNRKAQIRLWRFHDDAARALVVANKTQAIAFARFEAAHDIMEKLVADGFVSPREESCRSQ